VLRSVYLPDEGGYTVLGSTPLPRINGAQLENLSIIYHHPSIEPYRGQEMEGGSHGHNKTSPGSGQLPRGESAINGRIHDVM
jgi:hypothetical protein